MLVLPRVFQFTEPEMKLLLDLLWWLRVHRNSGVVEGNYKRATADYNRVTVKYDNCHCMDGTAVCFGLIVRAGRGVHLVFKTRVHVIEFLQVC